jgi:anti-repressor protein
MNNQLQIFNFETKEVRTVLIDGEPWWVAKDICEILEYKDITNAIKLHCKGVAKYHPLQTTGGMQNIRIINEPDLYRIIARSNLPEAEKFEKWIFEEILPSIRKTGQYKIGDFQIPKTYSEALRLAADQADQIEIMKPKAIGYDTFISNKSSQKIGDVAKVFGLKPNTLHKMLRDAKIMQDNYTPYAQYQHYFKTVETPTPAGFNKFTSYLLPEGVAFIAIKFNLIEMPDDQILKIN